MWENAQISEDVWPAQYHNWPENRGIERGNPAWRISRSELMQVAECGELFVAGGRRFDSESMANGSLVDAMLLTPAAFERDFAVAPLTYQKEVTKGRGANKITEFVEKPWTWQSNTCKAWRADQEAQGKTVVSQKEFAKADAQCQTVRHHQILPDLTLGQLIDHCHRQVIVTADWRHDSNTLVPCRAMQDMVRHTPRTVAYDLKTSNEVDRWSMKKSIKNYGYDVQSWMYSTMLGAALSASEVPFGFLCVRNQAPHLVATYRAGQETLSWGKTKFEEAIQKYVRCLQNGFAGYTDGFEEI